MKLTFTNGHQIEVLDSSTITGINFYVDNYARLDAILPEFTPENMLVVTLGEEQYRVILPESMSINHGFGDEQILVYVACRTKTDMEVMADEISELQDAVVELGEIIGG